MAQVKDVAVQMLPVGKSSVLLMSFFAFCQNWVMQRQMAWSFNYNA